MVKKNRNFAERLRDGELLIGTLLSLPSPEIAEVLAGTGFDWLFIDAEHSAFNPQQTQGMYIIDSFIKFIHLLFL